MTSSFDQGWNQALEVAAARCDDAAAWCAQFAARDGFEAARMVQANYLAKDLRALKRPQPANVRAVDGDPDLSWYKTAADLQRAREAAQAPSWPRADSGVE